MEIRILSIFPIAKYMFKECKLGHSLRLSSFCQKFSVDVYTQQCRHYSEH